MIESLYSATRGKNSGERHLSAWLGLAPVLDAYYLLKPPHDSRFGLRTDNTVDLSTFVEYEQSRDALNAEASRRGRILIDIELADAHSPCHLFRYFFDYWGDHTTRPAPSRPHVKQHRQP